MQFQRDKFKLGMIYWSPAPFFATRCNVIRLLLMLMIVCLAAGLANTAEPPEALGQLESKLSLLKPSNQDLLADVRLYQKAVSWALRYEQSLTEKDWQLINKALAHGIGRADELAESKSSWTLSKGKVLRGYISKVDGSTQPYGVILPVNYDGTRPMRLDVVLHGSSKPVGLSELKFGDRFDMEPGQTSAPDVDYVELHPLGRVENCYRWAGETDVFEAIEATCRNYNIDRDRIVLRGMSMGASGTWHLGLKHPDRFVALGPYCGYVDTHRFSETPVPNFIKVGQLPEHQELGLHMLDSVDYAANAEVVPTVAAIGDQDVFFQAHIIMGQAFAKEGLQMTNLISPGTGHVIDPVTHTEQMRQIGQFAAKGLDHHRREIRFVTWTLKYNSCYWIELLSLGKHYARAEIRARISDDGTIDIQTIDNITQFALDPPGLRTIEMKLHIKGEQFVLPKSESPLVFALRDGHWQLVGRRDVVLLTGKQPGLQGPIDDAFSAPFLCVRGTGKPWNPQVQEWAEATLRRFEYEWARYMRGDLPVKNDTELTTDDIADKHLILFGDPGSNSWIAKALPNLPLKWTAKQITFGDATYAAEDHAPACICRSPLAANRYLVLNSGHTFHEKEFAAFNYLLFPRLGDWGVLKISPEASLWQSTMADFPETFVRAGFFDETWRTVSPR